MLAEDFVYDGIQLSSKGYIVCDFDGQSDVNIVDVGSTISFNKIKRDSGRIYTLASATYDECVTCTFDICKDDCKNNGVAEISTDEFRELMRWLNRREFLPFRIVNRNQTVCWYNASFNIDKIIVGGRIYGARLTMETDRPFGYGDTKNLAHSFGNDNTAWTVSNFSNEIGYIYPVVTIHCLADGDLSIHNDIENCTTTIKNCSLGETITLNGETQTIISDSTNHKINNDFNWEFFRLGNKINNQQNNITVSKPCKLEIKYAPIIKDIP